jgi:spore germination protein KA
MTLTSLLHSPEDHALKWQYSTAIRFIRLVAIGIATFLPGLYVALTNFHQEMIPTDLLIAIAKAKENVPFPTIVEVLLMEVSFELIREAGIRIPGIIGNTLGIIGALILGQAAVQANIVSPILIIVVAVTGLGNFAVPNFSLAFGIRLIRFAFILAATILGFYGIAILLVIFAGFVMDMRCFGVPYYSPLAPRTRRSYDLILTWPVWKQEYRPDYLNPLREKRQPEISMKWKKEEPKYGYRRGGDGH